MAYPKKLSAYMLYNNAHRESTKAELIAGGNEKPSIAEIAKAVSLKWNALSDEEKAVRAIDAMRSRPRMSSDAYAWCRRCRWSPVAFFLKKTDAREDRIESKLTHPLERCV